MPRKRRQRIARQRSLRIALATTTVWTALAAVSAGQPSAGGGAAGAGADLGAAAAPAHAAQAQEHAAQAGAPAVRLHAALRPERLGEPTTIALRYAITPPAGEIVSPPVTRMRVMLPAGLSISSSELGLATCSAARLEAQPIGGCPRNSQIGAGGAIAEVPFGTSVVHEHVKISLYSGPLRRGRPSIVAVASGEHPVIADIVFGGAILEAPRPFEGMLDLTLPIVSGLPGGSDVALSRMKTTLGPSGITYTERLHGRLVRFHPRGIVLPRRCPRHGFRFAVKLSFLDGERAADQASVPCPRAARSHRAVAKRSAIAKRSRRRTWRGG